MDAEKLELSLLVVEDDRSILEVYYKVFQRRFKNVYTADNGKVGISQYVSYKPDIIITDVKMPIMDGLTMARDIRIMNGDIPIIMITALSDKFLIEKAESLNIDSYLTKPVVKEDLLAALDMAVDKAINLKKK